RYLVREKLTIEVGANPAGARDSYCYSGAIPAKALTTLCAMCQTKIMDVTRECSECEELIEEAEAEDRLAQSKHDADPSEYHKTAEDHDYCEYCDYEPGKFIPARCETEGCGHPMAE